MTTHSFRKRRDVHILSDLPTDVAGYYDQRYGKTLIAHDGSGAQIGVIGTSLNLSGVLIDWFQVVGRFEIAPQSDPDAIVVSFRQRGVTSARTRRGTIEANESRLLCMDVSQMHSVMRSPGSAATTLTLPKRSLKTRLEVLLERELRPDLEFFSTPNRNDPDVEKFCDFVEAIRNMDIFDLDFIGSTNADAFARMVIDGALYLLPNNRSAALRTGMHGASPRSVRLAVACIHDSLPNVLNANDIARECGVSLRCLQKAFKDCMGTGLIEYQRKVRLRNVRDELSAHPYQSVTVVALKWGFTNPGRLSQQFYAQFGYLPSKCRATMSSDVST